MSTGHHTFAARERNRSSLRLCSSPLAGLGFDRGLGWATDERKAVPA